MRRLLIAAALVLACTPPATTESPTPRATATSLPSAIVSPSPSPAFGDLKVSPAGDVRGDHALVLGVVSSATAGVPSQPRIWDVPLDGSAPRLLVAYTRGAQIFTEYDRVDLSRQLSADGRRLVLSDPTDVAGSALVVIDLIAGTPRKLSIGGAGDQPAWSPDGNGIAYRGFAIAPPLQKESGIWVVRASGGNPRQVWPSDLAAGSGAMTLLGWTEDASAIAFGRGSAEASVVEVATGKVTRVGAARAFAWRANRPAVALIVEDDARAGHVEVRDTTLASPKIVARYGASEGTFFLGASWNPKSDEILLSYGCGQGVFCRDELVIVDALTAARRTLRTASTPRTAAWTGSGAQILYTDLNAVRVMNADGSNERELFRPAQPGGGAQLFVTGVLAFASR
jgi:hypothetical protein